MIPIICTMKKINLSYIVLSVTFVTSEVEGFTLNHNYHHRHHQTLTRFNGEKSHESKIILFESSNDSSSSYDNSDSSSKGIVSSLTNIVNFVMGSKEGDNNLKSDDDEFIKDLSKLCTTPNQLMEKIRDDYIVNNYLWTGDIYLPAFEPDCQFTDPTLSFIGRDKFVSNVANLVPIVDFLTEEDDIRKSDLLDITLNEEKGYIESRWNMVGQLSVIPWKPCIDVIGRTKFWYRDVKVDCSTTKTYGNRIGSSTKEVSPSALRVYFYDEQWEMPAFRALLQLITPAGTIKS